ncbi:hypothetical protein TcWFU_007309 [Taenia crassiceps]|uniref:Hook C-terminal domain-containing protein n=1 Tax=Taenia crassiceps TaxID=6207 RepID=A0ABR4QSB7_9CEST
MQDQHYNSRAELSVSNFAVVKDMQQENHVLKLRLDMMKKMELEYIEEIEDLKGMVDSLTHQLEERRYDPPPESAGNLTIDASKSTVEIVQQIDLLQSELELSEKKVTDLESQNALLRERIDILELTKESTTLNTTVENTTNELIAEVDSLKTRLLSEVSEKERMHALLEEKEQDLDAAKLQINELQLAVKDLREETCDLTAELESFKLQAGSVGDSRGNSLFSEVEDRRRRAELLVKNQQIALDELKNELNSVQRESQRKILQLQRAIESNVAKADSALITQLYAEVDRLKTEVSRLESILNANRDQHVAKVTRPYLTDLREADRMSTAFRPDNSSQHNLIKALEERLLDYKCDAEKARQELTSMRERFMKEAHVRYDLNRELAQQRALAQCLSQKLQSLRIASNENTENSKTPPESGDTDSSELLNNAEQGNFPPGSSDPQEKVELTSTGSSRENASTNTTYLTYKRECELRDRSTWRPSGFKLLIWGVMMGLAQNVDNETELLAAVHLFGQNV